MSQIRTSGLQIPTTMTDSATSAQTNQPHVALITGAAQGIGRAIALRLAEDGLDIAIADLGSQRANLDGVAEEVRVKGRRCIVVECDVSREEEVQHMVQATEKEFDALDVMVANAGRILVKPMVDSTLTDFDRIFDTNVRGTFLCLRAAAQAMIKRGRGGRIISASSVSGKKGMPLNSIYCASKSAIRSFTQALASEVGSHGITVNAYAPGPVDTLFMHDSLEEFAKQTGLPDGKTFIQNYQAHAALTRIGTPEDIANMVSFLAGEDSSYITGQTITIDGGSWMD
ncbi:NAD(P)-binding protein [Suillus paluster]|uniref:NAD(P)-binding protein n=1 Tax=Suillus paluster TaxID=48578 RepID=UPI001B8727F2|nr:NAD(P)-binding protein [Suillus paluster]KAG1745110.1 NAD(P)-binding protein [Suillus paluster]